MSSGQTGTFLQCLRRIVRAHGCADGTDGQLLTRFIEQRDQMAFEALVRRHGPMVVGICRRVLGDGPDAEDAFQATFLVLVRKANSVSPREMVGNWLYGVGLRSALKARALCAKMRGRERPLRD